MTIDEKIAVLVAYNKLIDFANKEIDFYNSMLEKLHEKISTESDPQSYELRQVDEFISNIRAMNTVKEEIEKLALSK